MNVGILAVGGGIGQSIIKSLKGTKYTTVGIDPNPYAAGLYMADKGRIGTNCNDKKYIQSLIHICQQEKIKFLFPGLDAELEPLSNNFTKLKDAGITAIISDPAVIELSDDKYKLYEFLKEKGFPYIKTVKSIIEADKEGIECPVIVKPRLGGCRSQYVKKCESFKEVDDFIAENKGEYIIQEYIEGDEYTCGSVSFNKEVIGTIIMKRYLRDGDTYKAYVEENDHIDDFLNRLLPSINPFGPCNVQLRIRDNIPYILEINARCSGTTAARTLAGFNEPEITCNFLNNNIINYSIKPIAILRYWEEKVVEYKDIKELKDEGTTDRGKRWRWK